MRKRAALVGVALSVAMGAASGSAVAATDSLAVPVDTLIAATDSLAVAVDTLAVVDSAAVVMVDSVAADDSTATAGRRAAGAPAAGLASVYRWTDLLREDEVIVFEPGETRHTLRWAFLQFGSESIGSSDSLLVRNRDYGIDYSRGVVFLLARSTERITMRVRYLYLPAPRQRIHRAAAIETREVALASAAPAANGMADVDPLADAGRDGTPRLPARDTAPPPSLQLAGSNSIGVSFGRNREASLDQSLRVEASGELGEGLRVNAVLADDNLPVTAEGSTEELGDLSKVFIEMQGPVVGGVLGDYALARTQGDLVDVQRDLRGGEVRLQGKGQSLAVGAGLAKGEFVTTSFRGTEGKQGPYDLLSARRIDFSTIVPGSERVYADGRLLRRGENQDYIVDYDRGELRFTSRQRITADTEIAVDFQVNGAGYRRTSRDARFDGKARGFQVRGLVLSEGDDRDAPASGAYDAEEIAALEAAGDQTVIAPGIRQVLPGRGLYRRDVVDTTIVRYDPVAGDLEVDFYETGAGAGAYDDSLDALTGRRFFVHRGTGQGAFDIGRQLTPAAWLRLASAQVVASPTQALRLTGEASVSGFDANSFSTIGDNDNVGEAVDLRFDAGRHARPEAGGFGAKVHLSQLSPEFHTPGRARAPFYYKDWNAETDSLQSTERIAEATVGYGAGGAQPWFHLDANAGRLDRGEDLKTDRAQLELGLGRADRGIDVRAQALDSERPILGPEANRTRGFVQAGARYRLGRFAPELRFERDAFVRADIDSMARASYRYVDVGGRFGLLETRGTTFAIDVGRRMTDSRLDATARATGAEWTPSRRNDTMGLHLLARPTTSIATEIDVSRRTNEPLGPTGGAETRSDLARAVIGWNPRERAARIEWRHEISEEAVRTLQQVLVLAPDGKGDFDAEGRPMGRDLGTYDRVVRNTAEAEPVTQVESSLRLELGGFGGWASDDADSTTSWVRRNVSLVQVLAVKEQTRSEHIGSLAALWPSAFQTTSTVFGNFRARQEWSFLNASRQGALKLFLDFQNGLDARLSDNAIEDRERTATLRFERTSVARWTWGGETGFSYRARTGRLDGIVIGRPSSGSFDVKSARALGRLGWRFTASERLGIDFEATRQTDGLSATRQLLFTASPGATLAPTRNLRFLASAAVTQVLEDKPALALAPYFFDPPGTKTTMALLGSYRLGRSLQFNVTYNGVRNTDGRFHYDAKAETRAIF